MGSAGGALPLRSGQLFGYGAPACNAPREDPMDLIIFDLDGTLIDSGATLLAAQAETFRRCGRTHPGREAGLL